MSSPKGSVEQSLGNLEASIEFLEKEIDWFEALNSEQKIRACVSGEFYIEGMTDWLNEKLTENKGADSRDFADKYEKALIRLSNAVGSDEALRAAWDDVNAVCRNDYPVKHPDVKPLPYPEFLSQEEGKSTVPEVQESAQYDTIREPKRYTQEVDEIRIKWELPVRFTIDQLENKFASRAAYFTNDHMKNRNEDELLKLRPFAATA
ncbi:hypothetical protein QSV34_10795 [Porticoccus sp. W117]|uniref:hypothetical protein n=1 Tax=Porticoccus sp. W117 TaxID=3054777 RepID=UPI002599990A|nr:hypothetical protein [Porticoccus sp. W117]MDM3871837.1 hypothetical protein [Porticoccus sp. W117]